MPVSCKVKRTLVKSPPELWSEVSDPQSLARHLDGLGEISIVRAEPESEVEWEADGAHGNVKLEPSGFGTKVTLSLSREVVEPARVEADREPAMESVVEQEQVAGAEPEAIVEQEPVAEAEPEAIVEQEPVAEPRRGFFARLFKRRRKKLTAPEPASVEPASETASVEPPAVEPASVVVVHAPPEAETAPPGVDDVDIADIAADLATLEAEMAEQDETMLAAMLDRLGAAHHRPFSRG